VKCSSKEAFVLLINIVAPEFQEERVKLIVDFSVSKVYKSFDHILYVLHSSFMHVFINL